MRKQALIWISVVLFLAVTFSSAVGQILTPSVTVDVYGQQLSTDPIPRAVWEGHHISTIASGLFKTIETKLQKHLPIKQIRSQDSELKMDQIFWGPGPADYDFSIIDRFMANIDTLRDPLVNPTPIKLFFTITNVPRWLAESCADPTVNPIYNRPRPTDYDTCAAKVSAVVTYIKQNFGDRLTYYEVWNEPETEFWKCQADQTMRIVEYAKLYKYTVNAIKLADPTGKVGGPAIGLEKEQAQPNNPFPLLDKFLDEIRTALPPPSSPNHTAVRFC